MPKPKKPCTTCDGSGFVNVQHTLMTLMSDDGVECVPCWSCDLGLKIEKLEAKAERTLRHGPQDQADHR